MWVSIKKKLLWWGLQYALIYGCQGKNLGAVVGYSRSLLSTVATVGISTYGFLTGLDCCLLFFFKPLLGLKMLANCDGAFSPSSVSPSPVTRVMSPALRFYHHVHQGEPRTKATACSIRGSCLWDLAEQQLAKRSPVLGTGLVIRYPVVSDRDIVPIIEYPH